MPKDKIHIGLDGCGVPVHAMPLYNFALAFAKFSDPAQTKYEPYMKRVTKAMTENPFMVAGTNRICTLLPQVTKGRLLVKDGADGYFAMTALDKGYGVTFKMNESGFSVFNLVVAELVKQLGLVTDEEYEQLKPLLETEVRNNPGRVAARRETAFQLKKHA